MIPVSNPCLRPWIPARRSPPPASARMSSLERDLSRGDLTQCRSNRSAEGSGRWPPPSDERSSSRCDLTVRITRPASDIPDSGDSRRTWAGTEIARASFQTSTLASEGSPCTMAIIWRAARRPSTPCWDSPRAQRRSKPSRERQLARSGARRDAFVPGACSSVFLGQIGIATRRRWQGG